MNPRPPDNLPTTTGQKLPQAARRGPALTGTAVVLGGVGFAAFLTLSTPVLGILLTCAGVGCAVLGFWSDREWRRRLTALASLQAAAAGADVDTPEYKLRRRVTKFRYEPGVVDEATELLSAIDRAERCWKGFETELTRRLNPGELTFERYQSSGRDSFSRILAAIDEAASLLPVLKMERESAGARASVPAVPGSAAGHSDAAKRFFHLAQSVAAALGTFERLNAALAAIGGEQDSVRGLDETREDLERLARQADKYRKSP